MQINQIKRKTKRKTSKRVGRGGKRGKTSGRGTKGQKARAGRKIRPEMRDVIKRLPKRRGYRFNSIKVKPFAINLETIEKNFSDGEKVNPKILFEKKLLKGKGLKRAVKILSSGELTKKLSFSNCLASAKAKEKIEKVGGLVK